MIDYGRHVARQTRRLSYLLFSRYSLFIHLWRLPHFINRMKCSYHQPAGANQIWIVTNYELVPSCQEFISLACQDLCTFPRKSLFLNVPSESEFG
jgi:hypothetical protein